MPKTRGLRPHQTRAHAALRHRGGDRTYESRGPSQPLLSQRSRRRCRQRHPQRRRLQPSPRSRLAEDLFARHPTRATPDLHNSASPQTGFLTGDNVDSAPIYKAARNLHGKIDRWQFLEFRPPIYARITLGAREAGSDLPFGTPTHVVLNSFTPETERTTHYFWSTVRSWGLEDANVSKTYKDMTDLAFAEDARMVEAQQRLIDSDPSGTPLVSLAFDRAALAARRIIKRNLEEEAQATTLEPRTRPRLSTADAGAD